MLYKGHTFQKINPAEWDEKDIQKAIEWYQGAAENAIRLKEKYSNRPDVVKAQDEKLQEVQFVMQQIMER